MICPTCGSETVYRGECCECGAKVGSPTQGSSPGSQSHAIPGASGRSRSLRDEVSEEEALHAEAMARMAPAHESHNGHVAIALILGAQLIAQLLGAGEKSPVGIMGPLITIATIGFVLIRPVAAGIVVWLSVLADLAIVGLLVAGLKMPGAGLMYFLPAICKLGALYFDDRMYRWGAAALGVLLALAGPMFGTMWVESQMDAFTVRGQYTDAEKGFTLTLPEGVTALAAREMLEKKFPTEFEGSLAGGTLPQLLIGGENQPSFALFIDRQPESMPLERMLDRFATGVAKSRKAITRDDSLLAGNLQGVQTQGWHIRAGAATTLVVLAKTTDGRAFALFTPPRPGSVNATAASLKRLVSGLTIHPGEAASAAPAAGAAAPTEAAATP